MSEARQEVLNHMLDRIACLEERNANHFSVFQTMNARHFLEVREANENYNEQCQMELDGLREQVNDVLSMDIEMDEAVHMEEHDLEHDLLRGMYARVYQGPKFGLYILLPEVKENGTQRLNRQRYVYPHETTFFNGCRYTRVFSGSKQGRFYTDANMQKDYLPSDVTEAFLAEQYNAHVGLSA